MSTDNREVLTRLTDMLDDKHVKYIVAEHGVFHTTKQAAEQAGVSLKQGAKSMLFKSLGDYALAVLPSDQRVSYKKMRRVLEVPKLRLAKPAEVESIMGCEIGTCHPFGNILGITTICDPTMEDARTISFSAGLRTKSVSMAFSDYIDIVQPIVSDIIDPR